MLCADCPPSPHGMSSEAVLLLVCVQWVLLAGANTWTFQKLNAKPVTWDVEQGLGIRLEILKKEGQEQEEVKVAAMSPKSHWR